MSAEEPERRWAIEPPPGWVPDFPGQRPPFPPGHEVNLRHGAYTPKRVDPLATELVEGVLADPGTAYLRAAQWRPALWSWARAEAQVQLLSDWLASLDGVGDLADERVRAAYLLLHRAEARATTGRTRLGLDPLSAARLGKDRASAALDTAQLMQQLEAAERDREAQDEDDETGDADG